MRFTTQKAALCHALLNGEVLTIMDAFTRFGITNLPREISRSVEKAFGVTVSKWRTKHTNMFGEQGSHFVYRLWGDYKSLFHVHKSKRPAHRKGLKLMQKYVDEHTVKETYKGWMSEQERSVARFYADQAAKRVIPRSGKTTAEIIRDSIYTRKELDKIKKKIKNKKK